jgi:hypothetical protein
MNILCILSVLGMVGGVVGYSTGADPSACNSLTPSHGYTPQSSPSPYTITLSSSSFTAGGSAITGMYQIGASFYIVPVAQRVFG